MNALQRNAMLADAFLANDRSREVRTGRFVARTPRVITAVLCSKDASRPSIRVPDSRTPFRLS
jgi:hypothetical protein